MKFGENLACLHRPSKRAKEKIAEKLGIEVETLADWENGRAYPDLATLSMICELFHCRTSDLIGGNITDTATFTRGDAKEKLKLMQREEAKKYSSRKAHKRYLFWCKFTKIVLGILEIFSIIITILYAAVTILTMTSIPIEPIQSLIQNTFVHSSVGLAKQIIVNSALLTYHTAYSVVVTVIIAKLKRLFSNLSRDFELLSLGNIRLVSAVAYMILGGTIIADLVLLLIQKISGLDIGFSINIYNYAIALVTLLFAQLIKHCYIQRRDSK